MKKYSILIAASVLMSASTVVLADTFSGLVVPSIPYNGSTNAIATPVAGVANTYCIQKSFNVMLPDSVINASGGQSVDKHKVTFNGTVSLPSLNNSSRLMNNALQTPKCSESAIVYDEPNPRFQVLYNFDGGQFEVGLYDGDPSTTKPLAIYKGNLDSGAKNYHITDGGSTVQNPAPSFKGTFSG